MFTIVLAPTSAQCSTGARDSPLPDDAQLVQSTFKDDCGDYNDDYYYNHNGFYNHNDFKAAQVVQSIFRLLEVVMVSRMILFIRV